MAGSEIGPQAAAVEVGRIAVLNLYAGVDDLRAERLGGAKHAAGGHVVEHRIGLARQFGTVAEELLVDAAVAAVLSIGAPDDDVVALAEVGHRRLVLALRIVDVGVDQPVAVDRVAGGVVFAQVSVVIAAVRADVVVVEADDEAAGGQADHVGQVLVAIGVFVDAELAARGIAGGVVALAHDRRAAAVLVVVTPDDHVAAVGERCYLGLVLGAAGVSSVGQEGVAEA